MDAAVPAAVGPEKGSAPSSLDETLAAVAEIKEARQAILREIEKRIVGQRPRHRPAADRAVRARALPVRGRAGAGEDAAHLDAVRGAERCRFSAFSSRPT
jgi:hypothetical protein